MKKIIIGGLLAILVIVGAIVLFTASELDSLVEAAIEKYGPPITGTGIEVASVDISAQEGSGTLNGLVVGSPEGFDAPRTFSLDQVRIALDTSTLLDDVIVVREISIVAPQITYELSARSGSNIAAIQRNVAAASSGGGARTDAEKPGKKLIIERLEIRNAVLSVASSDLGGKNLAADLPDITLTDIGRKSNGVQAAEVTRQVLAALGPAISKAVADLGVDRLVGGAMDEGKGVPEQGKKDLQDGVGGAIKGIFGN